MANYILTAARAKHLNAADKKKFIRKTVVWLFRGMGHRAYKTYLKSLFGKRGLDVKELFVASGYLMKNLKLAIFYQAVYNVGWGRLEKEFGLSPSDEKLVMYASKMIPEQFKQHRAFTLREFDSEIRNLHKSLTKYTGRMVGKKMKFIVQSDNTSVNDIVGDLLFLAIQGVYWYYPRIESYPSCVQDGVKDHASNIAKNIIHNRGMNLIRYSTRSCRSVMLNTSDGGYCNSKLNIDKVGHSDPQYDFVVPVASCNITGDNTVDYDFTISQLVKHDNGPKWSTFIRLMGGKHDKIFTQWLRSKRITRTTNEDFYNQVAERRESSIYFNHVCTYLSLDTEQRQKYVNQIRWLCC